MNIVIDARTVTNNKTGVGNYIIRLLAGLRKIDHKNRYLIDNSRWRHLLKKVPVFSILGRLFFLFYDNFIYPLLLMLRRVDIYHNPAFILPLLNFPGKKIITVHDLGFYVYGKNFATGWHARHLRFMLPRSVKKADKIIAVSEATKQQIINIFRIPADKIVVTHEGVSDKFRRIEDREEIERTLKEYGITKPYILFVGTMAPRKNLKRLIEAFLNVKKEFPYLTLVIVGAKGELFDSGLDELIKKGDVITPGYVADQDLVYFYNGADVFAFPSLYEGFGLPILEAMACGTPVLTSNTYSMPEVAGDAAVLVDPENLPEIMNGLKALLSDPSLREKMRVKGFARARQFTWEKTAQATLTVYREVGNA